MAGRIGGRLKAFVVLVMCSTLFSFAQSSFALGPVRCNGRIQFRPCGQEYANGSAELNRRRLSARSDSSAADPRYQFAPSWKVTDHLSARIVSQSFHALERNIGEWRGEIEGNGRVHLVLEILQGDRVALSTYMGNVKLLNKKTTFAFKTALPKLPKWNWRLATYATPVT